MDDDPGFDAIFGIFLFIGFVILISAKMGGGCSDPDTAREILESHGYSDIETGGYDWFACSDDDRYSTSFTATAINGTHVSGAVCCGYVKNCTVRYD